MSLFQCSRNKAENYLALGISMLIMGVLFGLVAAVAAFKHHEDQHDAQAAAGVIASGIATGVCLLICIISCCCYSVKKNQEPYGRLLLGNGIPSNPNTGTLGDVYEARAEDERLYQSCRA